jgi:hypothetical protein
VNLRPRCCCSEGDARYLTVQGTTPFAWITSAERWQAPRPVTSMPVGSTVWTNLPAVEHTWTQRAHAFDRDRRRYGKIARPG